MIIVWKYVTMCPQQWRSSPVLTNQTTRRIINISAAEGSSVEPDTPTAVSETMKLIRDTVNLKWNQSATESTLPKIGGQEELWNIINNNDLHTNQILLRGKFHTESEVSHTTKPWHFHAVIILFLYITYYVVLFASSRYNLHAQKLSLCTWFVFWRPTNIVRDRAAVHTFKKPCLKTDILTLSCRLLSLFLHCSGALSCSITYFNNPTTAAVSRAIRCCVPPVLGAQMCILKSQSINQMILIHTLL